MTTPSAHTLLSVRGQAQRFVAPDQADIYASVAQTLSSKHQAAEEARGLLASLVTELADVGGVALTAANRRAPLTWSAQSLTTAEEMQPKPDGYGPTGRHTASINLVIAIRDFELLARVEASLTARDAIAVHSIRWSVDEDNPEWGHVRADAINAALVKGQDYASALGGSVVAVEHVADAGLLGGGGSGGSGGERRTQAWAGSMSSGGGLESTSLDPMPQILEATVEARLRATAGPLPQR